VPLPCLALPGMMVEIEAIAMLATDAKGLERTVANLSDLAPLPPPFSHGVRCRDHIWTSALRSQFADSSMRYPHDLMVQTAATLEQLAQVLGALGADLDDIVKLSTWYQGDGTRTTWEPVACKQAEYFTAPGPAISALPTPSLPHGKMTQVDAWAMRGADGNRLTRTYAHLPALWQWPGGVSQATGLQCDGLVFVSQQVALDVEGHPVAPGNLMAQTQQVIESTRSVLTAFGLTLDDMVKQNSFYQGKADPETIVSNQRYRSSFYHEPAGASTGVPLPCLPLQELMVSVETVAMTRE